MQGTWVWSLVGELRYCRVTTETGESLDAAAKSPVHSDEDPAQPIFFFFKFSASAWEDEDKQSLHLTDKAALFLHWIRPLCGAN